MDFDLPSDDDPRRVELRAWLEKNPKPSPDQLLEAGLIVPHWPAPHGLDADPLHQLIIDDELGRARVRRPVNPIGIGWAAPTILLEGTEAQKQRYLPPLLKGEEIWCQLFSEPDAGSDLAGLSTRAVRDGDEYVVNGAKIWSSYGHYSKFGILIARTDPDTPKQQGISYFICPMDQPGLTMQPIIDMTATHAFNQVFFDDMRLPAENLVGTENDGWRLAKMTLANERVSLSSAGSLWGSGPGAADLIRLLVDGGGVDDPVMRQRVAKLHSNAEVLRLNRLRTLSSKLRGKTPGPEASIQKVMADEHGQDVMTVAKDLAGPAGMLEGLGPAGAIPGRASRGAIMSDADGSAGGLFPDVDRVWHYGYQFAPALTLGGGTFAVQRNIIAESVLGLPREPDAEEGLTWAEAQRKRV